MSIIEQAAKRLEQLRVAGVAIPWEAAGRPRGSVEKHSEVVAKTGVDVGVVPRVSAGDLLGRVELDLARLQQAGHVVPIDARSSASEEFRHVKRPLWRNARGARPESRMSLIMVTSALPGEGKTFCAINLAMSMAREIDTSVLLVDADVVRPEALTRLGVSPRMGLLDLLIDQNITLEDVMLATNVPKLTLLPAGNYNSRSTELLASDAMNRLLGDLAVRYSDHVVIFDSPPLLVTSEAKVLASRVGQVLVVVEACKTPCAAIERAFATLEQCQTVMSLLNKGDEPAPGYGYGDYYG